jgi:D-3-phosphoglycerate dehydrogenase
MSGAAPARFRVQTLNDIAAVGLERLPAERYEVGAGLAAPHAILLRSADMHQMALPEALLAVARAGAGTNNVPVAALSARGVPVFNAPGANANAVKELVIAGLFIAARNLAPAWGFVAGLLGEGLDPEALEVAVEKGKKRFVGRELPGRTLGVVGLGAIGVKVANAARALGMRVVGYDPEITVQRAWQLDAAVEQAQTLDQLFARADFITVHVPLVAATRGVVNAQRLKVVRPGAVLLNFSREQVVEEEAVAAALGDGRLAGYITDFPSARFQGDARVVMLPHLGASTVEAEENCAVMVAEQLREFLEHGNVRNSVNFPEVVMPRAAEAVRLGVANRNVPNMVGQMTTALARADLNIVDLINKSRGDLAWTLVDVAAPVPESTLAEIRAIDGVLAARVI